jgi:hypothetical protein
MARIRNNDLDRLKSEVSLARLVESSGIELKQHGKDYLGLCPFHDDKEPSLVISPRKLGVRSCNHAIFRRRALSPVALYRALDLPDAQARRIGRRLLRKLLVDRPPDHAQPLDLLPVHLDHSHRHGPLPFPKEGITALGQRPAPAALTASGDSK